MIMEPAATHILIADDDPGIRTALRATLEAEHYQVTSASDGRVAIEAILHGGVDLAILDLSMPYFDGLEVLKELRILCGPERMPRALILTAYGSVTAAVESARRGAVDFLSKPISPEQVRTAVRRALAGLSSHPMLGPEENYFG
jgi:DNA-binding NtrC family response regulator